MAPNSTVQQLKEKSGRIGWNVRLRGKPLKNHEELEAAGVQPNDELHAFRPSTAAKPDAQYNAQRRLNLGLTKKSIAHRDLHRATQSVIMNEHKRTREALGEKMDDQTRVVTDKLNGIEATQEDQVAKVDELHAWMRGGTLERGNGQKPQQRLQQLQTETALRAKECKELRQEIRQEERKQKAEEKKKAKEEEKKKAAEAKAQAVAEAKEAAKAKALPINTAVEVTLRCDSKKRRLGASSSHNCGKRAKPNCSGMECNEKAVKEVLQVSPPSLG